MMGSKNLIVLFLSLIATHFAKADILFVDFNGAVEERAAAERAAKARGEKLIVIPKMTQAEQNQYRAAKRNSAAIYREISADGCFGEKPPPSCEAKAIKSQELHEKIYEFTQKYSLNSGSLARISKDLSEQGTKISSMVISGHDGNGNFTGTNGSANYLDFKAMAEANPKAFESMRGLMLWGCYTATPGEVDIKWKKAFPNIELVAGYDGRAPMANSPSSSIYLEDVLVKEKSLARIKDKNELAKQFKGLKDIYNVHGALCSNEFFANQKGVVEMSALKQMCSDMPTSRWEERINCYKAALPGCEDIPKDTDNGELRKIYNEVQSYTHCNSLYEKTGKKTPDPEEVLRLLFFNNVKNNFLKNHQKETDLLNESLRKMGASSDLMLTDIGKLSRLDLLKKLDGIDKFLAEKEISSDILHENNLEDRLQAKSLHQAVSMVLNDVSSTCSPFSWVEPHEGGESACMARATGKPERFKMEAETLRVHAVQSRVEMKMNDMFDADPDILKFKEDVKKGISYDNPALDAEIKKIVANRKEDISKFVAEERNDLKTQAAIPAESQRFSRETYLNQMEGNPEGAQSVLYLKMTSMVMMIKAGATGE